ncbi:MAG: ATP-binding protein [Alphaproteobacteria bacterium]|jgi:serine/threonine-protein kinase RsbT|nr:ATP-binding protein [Alphaproteobacteria bacterium]
MTIPQRLTTKLIDVACDRDIAAAREAGLALAAMAGMREGDGVRFATAISELARNTLTYAERGVCRLALTLDGGNCRLEAQVTDRGPGIDDDESALSHDYSTGRGLGIGLPGARKLVDDFDLSTSADGTTVRIAVEGRVVRAAEDTG